MSKGSEPAFPPHHDPKTHLSGLSKHEYFAAMAMQAFLTATFTDTGGQCVGITGYEGRTEGATPERIAKYAIDYADALLAELERTEK